MYIRVHRKYLSLDSLDYYRLPWEWDKVSLTFMSSPLSITSYTSSNPFDETNPANGKKYNSDYLIIKKYIDHNFQDELFWHTKMLRQKKYITGGFRNDVMVTLKPQENIVKKDQLFLVRNKSKSFGRNRRASWTFT